MLNCTQLLLKKAAHQWPSVTAMIFMNFRFCIVSWQTKVLKCHTLQGKFKARNVGRASEASVHSQLCGVILQQRKTGKHQLESQNGRHGEKKKKWVAENDSQQWVECHGNCGPIRAAAWWVIASCVSRESIGEDTALSRLSLAQTSATASVADI